MRRIVGDILLVLVVLLTADVVIVMPGRISAVVRKRDHRKVFLCQLILCAIFLAFALDVRSDLFTSAEAEGLRAAGWVLRTGVALFCGVAVFFCGRVIAGGMITSPGRADYALVLGLGLKNGKPTPDLLKRLDAARAYLEEYPEAKLILTGGNPDETGRTEAAVMRELLTRRGVPEDRLILEDKARSTKENFANIAGLISPDEPVVMISSDYHMDRAVRTARGTGFSNIRRLPAPSDFFAYGANMTSEVVLDLHDLKNRLCGQTRALRP